eukprot:g5368.t1
MDSQFTLIGDILNTLLRRLKEVTANREGCQFMLDVAEQMQGVLRQLEEKQIEESIETTLTLLTEAVIEAREIVEKTCSVGFISSMLFHEEYASTLTKISAKVEDALFKIPITSLEMNLALGFDIVVLLYLVHHANFEKLATMNDPLMALKNILETAFHNDRKEPQDLKKIVEELSKEHLMSKEELNEGLEMLKIEASNAKKSQNTQREFECNALIQVLSKTQHDASGSQNQSQEKSQKLEDCLRCPISDEIMTDPVILKETGMTYDRSSIEEWFKRGNDRDPLTNVRLESKELMPNFALRAACLIVLGKLENSSSSVNDPSTSKDKNESHKILVEAQKEIIDVNLNINSQDGDGWTKLHFASKTNSIEAVKDLISHGANVNPQNNYGESPLYIAAKTSSIDVVKELIAHGANIDLQNKNGASPLHIASLVNSIHVAKELIAHGAIVDLQNKYGASPLYIASQMNFIDVAKELITHGANIDLQNKYGESPLYIASEKNSSDVAKELIAHGANIDLQNKNGASPLYTASEMNSIDVAKELIAHGANTNLQHASGASPLYIASQSNSIDVAKELMANGANVHFQKKDGWTPLHIAASCGQLEIVKILLEHGASRFITNNKNETPLKVLCSSQSFAPYNRRTIAVLKLLLSGTSSWFKATYLFQSTYLE